jgi:ATP-dependent Clp protease ATP-binding subunit ClpC
MHPGLRSWKNLLLYAFYFFPIPLLFKTLFSPWRRDTARDAHLTVLEKIVFAILTRLLGMLARLALIALGLLLTTLALLTFPIFFFLPIKIERDALVRLPSFGTPLSYGQTFHLNRHGRDLFAPASLRLFGKEKALQMIERGLVRSAHHNVLLVGEAGSGKTTVLHYLGRLGYSGLSFPGIRNHRVVALPLEELSLEDFDKCLDEAARAGNIILVLENIHLYESIYERLLPYLAAPELGIVATTDFSGYDRVLKGHSEFLSKFEKVDILPTGSDDTLAILGNAARFSGTKIKSDALFEIVRLSRRFIGNEVEPARSLAVLEELGALGKTITVEDVRRIVSDKTNVPIGSLGQNEARILSELEEKMHRKIIGQDEAVRDVSSALKRLRTGVSDPSRPAGSFLFLGPTGVGKTHTAKILAESYFGRSNAMIRFDMSEFSLPEEVPVFVNRLASVIEEAPLSLVFFDELEKADRLVHNLLLQVLDEGRLTRESGREASFKNAIIIATSNAGSAFLIENPRLEKKVLLDNLIRQGVFSPEFLNRFSGIVLFRPLGREEVRAIASLLLSEFAERLEADKGIRLEITEALVDQIASAGFDSEFGARPLRRAIEELVENKVAELILSGQAGKTIKLI